MLKILGGLLAAVLIAAAGFFGFEFYVQHRVQADVEAAFAAVRASGAKASHGPVSFDLWRRTITVADIAGESAAQPPVSIKIGRFTAAGVSQPDSTRFSADRIEATDVAIAGTMTAQAPIQASYHAPRIEIEKYSGPAGPLRALDPAVAGDVVRLALEQFAAVSAATVTAPAVSGHMTAPGAAGGLGDYTYSGLVMRDIRDGRIATMTVDRVAFTAAMNNAGKPDKMTGEAVEMIASDSDLGAVLAMFDPARAKDDNVYRAYRELRTGAYSASTQSGMRFRMDGLTATDIGVKPSKLQFSQLMAIVEAVPQPGTAATPAQLRDLLDKVGGLYEGIYLGSAEMRGLAMDLPDGPFRLAAIRLGSLDNGKLAEFALEGLDAGSPQGPVKLGRFMLKSIDVANLMRVSGQIAALGNDPAPEQMLALLALLEGGEIRNLVAPYKVSGQPVNIDTLSLMWGQFVGPFPTRARATLKMSGPVDVSDPEPFNLLAGAGVSSATVNFDLGAAWNENALTFALEPVTLEIGNVFAAAARASTANVARAIFSLNPLQAVFMASQAEAGPLEIALRDTGGVELMVAQLARRQNVTREAARQAMVANVRATAMQMASANADAMAIAGAISRFIETPRGTLTIKLTPRGKVAMMELVDALRKDPVAALARFQVEATNTR